MSRFHATGPTVPRSTSRPPPTPLPSPSPATVVSRGEPRSIPSRWSRCAGWALKPSFLLVPLVQIRPWMPVAGLILLLARPTHFLHTEAWIAWATIHLALTLGLIWSMVASSYVRSRGDQLVARPVCAGPASIHRDQIQGVDVVRVHGLLRLRIRSAAGDMEIESTQLPNLLGSAVRAIEAWAHRKSPVCPILTR